MSRESQKDRLSRLADQVHAQSQVAEICLREFARRWDGFKAEHQEAILVMLEVLEYELKKAHAYKGMSELVDLTREKAE